MRVSTKMTLGLSATCLVIMAIHGYNQLRDEDRDLRTAVEREIRLLGDAVRVAVESSLRDGQMQDIQRMLDSTDRIDPTVDIVFFDTGGRAQAASPGSVPDEELQGLAERSARGGVSSLVFDRARRPGRIVLALPLRSGTDVPDGGSGSLVLVRPLTEMNRDLADTRRGIVVSVILLVLAATALQFILGTVYVTRPLSAMARAMQKLRSDEWISRLGYDRHDEVGVLAREFDAMVTALDEARRRIAREVESRTSLERGLQTVDKLVTVGQISAGLAHEIGSPLQILNGRARALLARDHTPAETRRHAQILAEQTDRIARIVEQLMQFARRRPARFTATSLAGPVQAVLDLIEPTARRRGVALDLVSAPDLPEVVADVDQVQQIALNLLKNAVEASAPGTRIALRLEPSTLSAPDGASVPAARIQVDDEGCGMSEEVLHRLFEPFFTTRAAEGGTGLGMAVVKSIVTEHGGRVSAASTPGRGSRITIDLPRAGPAAMRGPLQAEAGA